MQIKNLEDRYGVKIKSLKFKELGQQRLILLDSEVGLKGWILETCKLNIILILISSKGLIYSQ